jgi:hypothetical protein
MENAMTVVVWGLAIIIWMVIDLVGAAACCGLYEAWRNRK